MQSLRASSLKAGIDIVNCLRKQGREGREDAWKHQRTEESEEMCVALRFFKEETHQLEDRSKHGRETPIVASQPRDLYGEHLFHPKYILFLKYSPLDPLSFANKESRRRRVVGSRLSTQMLQ
jgi:hypothetical protein